MLKRAVLLFVFLVSLFIHSYAHEGMWLPHLLKQIEGTMQEMGMKMSAEDIWSVNHSSLKDAIVHFGGGCTSSLVSSQGLLLTNHHCGYGQIQSHSTVENNLLRNGFWAADFSQELPNPGLTATLIRRIEDVTDIALAGVAPDMNEQERQSRIDRNLHAYESLIEKADYENHFFRPFYYGNQYLLFITITYRDVRLVGTPPESIGKFGADTDNWMWPRHTGDFMFFRVYAGPDNLPADYSTDNVPYQPAHHLPVSMDGVEEGDFTLVFGFPGRTQQYLPGAAVEMTMKHINPPAIALRDTALHILGQAMRADEATRIQYASKFARIANAWKKWIGENQGLYETDALGRKQALEATFAERVKGNPDYEGLLPSLHRLYREITPFMTAQTWYAEVMERNVEIFTPARIFGTLAQRYQDNGEAGYIAYRDRVRPMLERFYRDYRPDLDQEVFTALMRMYAAQGNKDLAHPLIFRDFSGTRAAASTRELFGQTMLLDAEVVLATLEESPESALRTIRKDPLIEFYATIHDHHVERVSRPMQSLNDLIQAQMRRYMAAQMEVMEERAFYPDANSTLRVTFGMVEGYQPEGKPRYDAQTWLSGVVAKYVPGDYEFDVPERLLLLERAKDYGPYGVDTEMPVCFIGSNHTTGGNSGSPALDAHGNLIGLNFDRVWEGTMSDLNFDPSICRNIMVDARYILFIVDKFAGARNLIEEMTLVHPKRG
jgi:hypothetical protein